MSEEAIVHLTDGPAMKYRTGEWPVVARLAWADADDSGGANERAYVRVRRHADGRHLVYGLRERGTKRVLAGFVASGHRDVTDAIHKACALVGLDPIELFFDMPAVSA